MWEHPLSTSDASPLFQLWHRGMLLSCGLSATEAASLEGGSSSCNGRCLEPGPGECLAGVLTTLRVLVVSFLPRPMVLAAGMTLGMAPFRPVVACHSVLSPPLSSHCPQFLPWEGWARALRCRPPFLPLSAAPLPRKVPLHLVCVMARPISLLHYRNQLL